MSLPRTPHSFIALVLLLGPLGAALHADEPLYVLPTVVTYSDQVANQTPVASFAMPVSGLRFEPRVDVQARNFAEGQADVAIRGGLFENTGFKVGAFSVYDPQTGHYLAELPIAPAMLTSPRILTGADNAAAGFNAEVGTIAYGWRPVEQRGEASISVGEYSSNRQSLYQGLVLPGTYGGQTLGVDVDLSRSESDGSVPYGDHHFKRAAGRIQLRSAHSQTDLFAGWQHKFFGWPNLYTPFGVNESEDITTELYSINHRVEVSPGSYWQIGGYSRRNFDDYEFNRLIPGQFNPYQHVTRVHSLALDGRQQLPSDFALGYSAQLMRDKLWSTALTFGPYRTRTYQKFALVPERTWALSAGKLTVRAGATYDDTNRDASAISPVIGADFVRMDGLRFYAQYAESTQVATYTALKSNPSSGLFRGNQALGRQESRNVETGVAFKAAGWKVQTAVFYRWDDDLVDWTYTHTAPNARSANAVDIGTAGVEIVATRKTPRYDLIFGYTYLDKDADYGSAIVDASFYALNFARHRVTAAAIVRMGGGFEVRVDNEYRAQEKNSLRTTGGHYALLSSVGLYYLPAAWRGLELSAQVENLWDSDFQEVPAVRAARRQFSVGAAWRW